MLDFLFLFFVFFKEFSRWVVEFDVLARLCQTLNFIISSGLMGFIILSNS